MDNRGSNDDGSSTVEQHPIHHNGDRSQPDSQPADNSVALA